MTRFFLKVDTNGCYIKLTFRLKPFKLTIPIKVHLTYNEPVLSNVFHSNLFACLFFLWTSSFEEGRVSQVGFNLTSGKAPYQALELQITTLANSWIQTNSILLYANPILTLRNSCSLIPLMHKTWHFIFSKDHKHFWKSTTFVETSGGSPNSNAQPSESESSVLTSTWHHRGINNSNSLTPLVGNHSFLADPPIALA